MADYIRPVEPVGGRMSSFTTHTRRTTPSREPGTDYYVPIGTPVRAPRAGVVAMTGDSIVPATGRFIFIQFDQDSAGRRMSGRALHLKRRYVNVGDRVRQGQIIGLSGATGYGKEDWSADPATGGAHVHWTQFPTHTMRFGYDAQGRPYSVDFEALIGGTTAGGGASPFPTIRKDDDMILLKGQDSVAATGEQVIVVASPGVWDRYNIAFEAALEAQFGPAVKLNPTQMREKETLYKGAYTPLVNAIKAIPAAGGGASAAAVANEFAKRLQA